MPLEEKRIISSVQCIDRSIFDQNHHHIGRSQNNAGAVVYENSRHDDAQCLTSMLKEGSSPRFDEEALQPGTTGIAIVSS